MLITRGIEKKTLSHQMFTSYMGFLCHLHIQGHNPNETCIWTYYFQLVQQKCTIFSSKFMNIV